jgi:tetratricopeptide (TPR) repeat protein
LFLDADDVVEDPESVPGLCEELARRGVQVAATRYVYDSSGDGGSRSECYRERLARNCPEVAWSGLVHENLRGSAKTALVQGNLVVRDMKDNAGLDVRVPGRCLKVLYHHARSRAWDVEPRVLLYLAMESRTVLPDFCLVLVERYLDASLWPEERAWACSIAGEVHEERGDFQRASGWYERSLAEYPGSKSAYRLCRSRFREEKWRECVDAYEVGEANRSVLHLLDDGPAYADRSKILVAAAWEKLGEYRRALRACEEAMVIFPGVTNLELLRDQLLLVLGE